MDVAPTKRWRLDHFCVLANITPEGIGAFVDRFLLSGSARRVSPSAALCENDPNNVTPISTEASRRVSRIYRNVHFGRLAGAGLIAVSVTIGVALCLKRDEPIEHLDVQVVASNYRLYFHYPGADSKLGTADDRLGTRNFYAPANTEVRLSLTSRDFVYLVEIPEVGLYEVAAPELDFEARFETGESGVHSLLGSQMCGYDHSELIGEFVVQRTAEFKRLVRELSPAPSPTNPTQ
ncbi:hypothetical protein [Stieleria magnilauensis]|uniref:hypothetical protein n=1 Tax=Stieleria magnilauensis TaxID=2527963 RepID=UPI003AF695AF